MDWKDLEKILDKFAWAGIPGLVFIIVMSFSPFAGGAAIMSTLAILGGPFGAIGGIGLLIVLSKYSNQIKDFGYDKFIGLLIKRMKKEGKNIDEIITIISNYPIKKGLKNKIINKIKNINML